MGEFGRAFARFVDGFDILVALPEARRRMREALVSRCFPEHAPTLLDLPTPTTSDCAVHRVAEDEIEYGRSPAFRRKILEIYDHQCAACGLRIRLPQAQDVSFIDAAHLIPFSESHNDHPSNGLALFKNHHWAMERNLIGPCPAIAGMSPRSSKPGGRWGRPTCLPSRTAPSCSAGTKLSIPPRRRWNGGAGG